MGADKWFYCKEDEDAVKVVMKYCLTLTLMAQNIGGTGAFPLSYKD